MNVDAEVAARFCDMCWNRAGSSRASWSPLLREAARSGSFERVKSLILYEILILDSAAVGSRRRESPLL